MDWGGIIASSMAGGAKAIGEMADDTMKRRDLELAQQRAEAVAIKGEERRAALQRENAAYEMDLKLKREEEQGKRYQAQTDQITDKAKTMDSERQVGSMTKLRDSLPQEGEFAGQAISAKDIASLPPEARAAYERAGLIERSSGSQQLRDQIDAARSIGADKPVRDDLRTSLTAQMAAEEKVRKEARDDRTDLRKDEQAAEDRRANRVAEDGRARRDGILASRASGGGGAREGESKFTSAINSAQRGLADLETRVGKKFRPPTPTEEVNAKKMQAYIDEKNAFLDADPEIKTQLARLNGLREKEARQLYGEAGMPANETKPATPAAKPSAISIPPQAVSKLKSDPTLAAAFDQKYGAGASKQYLK